MLLVSVLLLASCHSDDAPIGPEPGEQRKRATTKSKSSSRRSSRRTITIRQGQTLGEIARKYGTTVSKLRRLNGLKNNNIRAGKKLRVR